MLRTTLVAVAAIVSITYAAVHVSAQSQDRSPNRRTTLLDRIEKLRRALVEGDSTPHQNQYQRSRGQRTNRRTAQRQQRQQAQRAGQAPKFDPLTDAPVTAESAAIANPKQSSRRSFQPNYEGAVDMLVGDSANGEDRSERTPPEVIAGEVGIGKLNASTAVVDNEDGEEGTDRIVGTTDPGILESVSPSSDLPGRGGAPRSLQERLSSARRLSDRTSSTSRPTASSRAGSTPSLPGERFGHTSDTPAPGRSRSMNSAQAPIASDDQSGSEPTPRVSTSQPGTYRQESSGRTGVATPASRTAAVPRTAPVAGGTARSAPADDILFVRRSPSLGVETSGPRRIKIGQKAAYQVTLYNRGEVDARDVVVTIKLPAWTTIAGTEASVGAAHASADAEEGHLVEWTLDRLGGGGREELVLMLVPNKSRPFDLAVRWDHSPVTSQAMVEVQEPKLQLALSGPDEVDYGQNVVYKLTLSNPGTGDAEDVVVRLLPTAPGETEMASYPIGSIRAGAAEVVELELTAQQSGLLVIKAEAAAEGGLLSQITEEVLVRRGHLDVEIAGPRFHYAGTVANYKIRVSNPGNAVARNVELLAMLPTGAEYVSSKDGGQLADEQGHVKWHLPSLAAGSEETFWLKCKLNSAGTNRPQVVAVADGDLKDTALASTEVETVADLVLDVRDPRGPIRVGDEVIYEVHVHNRGTKSAEAVKAVAFFSPGIEPSEVEGGSHRLATGQVIFDPIPVLGAGDEIVLTIKAIAQQDGNHVFRAEVHCTAIDLALAEEETTRFYDDRESGQLADDDLPAPGELRPHPDPIYEAKRPD